MESSITVISESPLVCSTLHAVIILLTSYYKDRGGTFCDVIVQIPGREDEIFKLLSVDPQNYADAPTEAVRRALEIAEGRKISKEEKLDGSRIASCRIGTTVATNALLEKKGEKFALLTTKGI